MWEQTITTLFNSHDGNQSKKQTYNREHHPTFIKPLSKLYILTRYSPSPVTTKSYSNTPTEVHWEESSFSSMTQDHLSNWATSKSLKNISIITMNLKTYFGLSLCDKNWIIWKRDQPILLFNSSTYIAQFKLYLS